jgi:hypothetical protein
MRLHKNRREGTTSLSPNRARRSWLLATFGEVESMGTSTRGMEKLFPSDGAVFLTLLRTGTRGETSKGPRFTKCGQEPNGMKLSSNILPYQGFACLSAWSGSLQASLGQRVTAWGSIHGDRVARRLPKA